jgi:pimeloyl-ACP methyl ester carboxylesterase
MGIFRISVCAGQKDYDGMMNKLPEHAHFLASYEGNSPSSPKWFESVLSQKPERGQFECKGTAIELLTWGEVGKPGLLFVHGNRAHADWWSFIAPYFARDWRCAAFSLSGMGGSETRAQPSTVVDFVAEAIGAVTAASLDAGGTAPILIGHSLGGSIGVRATSGNDIFGGLILVDTPINFDPDRTRAAAAQAPKARESHRPFPDLRSGLARFRLSPPQHVANDFIGDFLARKSLVERDGEWFWKFDPRGIRMGCITNERPLTDVRCPIALLYGEDSAFFQSGEVEAARHLLPEGSQIIGIPNAAHHVALDQPEALVVGLRTLLSRWPGR